MNGDLRWLEVQAESGTCLFTLSRCLALADLQADGDCKLVLADIGGSQNVLKVLKGMSVIAETTLPELPSGVVALYNDTRHPRCPLVAVASGPSVYVYRNLKPYFKFSLPALEVNALEVDLWLQVRDSGMEARALYDMLLSLQQELGFSQLSQQSQRLLVVAPDDDEELRAQVTAAAPFPLSRRTVITCMASLQKSSTEPDAVSCLVIGSEDGAITFVDTEAFTVIDKVDQREDHGARTIPASLQTSGLLDVEFRILICNRDGKLTLLRRGWAHTKVLVQLSVKPVDMVYLDSSHLVVASCSQLECYSKKGRRQWELELPGGAIGITKVPLEHQGITLVAVAIKGGQVCLYSGRHLVDVISAPDSVTAMTFGRFGQEDHCLILVTAGGTLLAKMLKRTAQFAPATTPTATQVLPKLPIPKRTRLLVEQVARERENPIEIHQGFQRGLFRLRLVAARDLADSINRSSHLISNDANLPLKMSAQVFGLGPTFKIRLSVDNMAASLTQKPPRLSICVHYNHALYSVSRPYLPVPYLVPGLVYTLETMVTALGEVQVAEEVQVFLVSDRSTKPLLSASVHIPVCDLLPIEI